MCVLGVVVAAAATAGCSTTDGSASGSASCASRQISPIHGRVGRCISGRNLYVITTRDHPVRLSGAAVSLAGVAAERALPGGRARIVVALRIANSGSRPLDWRHRVVERAVLISGGRRYFARFDATSRNARPIPPRAVGRRTLGFDLAVARAARVSRGKTGVLFFAADIPASDTDTTIGVIRVFQ